MSKAQQCLRVKLNTRVPAAADGAGKTPQVPPPCSSASAPPPTSTQCSPSHPQYFRVIGRGTCGTVYEHAGLPTEVAIKVGSDRAAIKRDFNHALRAYNASRAPRSPVSLFTGPLPDDEAATLDIPRPLVPRPRKMLDDHDLGRLGRRGLRLEAVDDELSDGGPEDFTGAEIPSAWEVERIGPIAATVRDALVDLYVQPALRETLRANDESRDCLVRVYLGAQAPSSSRQRQRRQWHLDSGLRNAPLYLDQMDEARLDPCMLAEEVGVGIATCQWAACLDGMDVEFVLGGPRLPRYRDRAECAAMPEQPEARMWMLDYDKTTLLPFVARGSQCPSAEELVERFAVSMHGNDPYFPRPSLDRALWDRFVEVYVLTARSILRNTKMPASRLEFLLDLPREVMARLAELYEEEEQWQRDADDLVGFEDGRDDLGEGWGSEDVSSISGEDEEECPSEREVKQKSRNGF
ncbi:hypothetical protein PFICI_07495 [Pestalotiopsis fici W106-1]|uniref:DUF3669 domain-containing protein n=1 Tax=Pestalotiopsis fici (strain W106-1 / CGMCC3.15140) TaxID=1229662 RepID=W3X464_PESFW|nr:uncharacterized protein PFICI_07495 [Pestalotiopsis fici W106-1]ETS79966.1 hypothetical protein PFICI_07495 [Pestalotiopsis fici W106-1]